MTIDKPFLRELRAELDKVLGALGKQHGVSITVGNASYTPASATFKVNVATIGENGEVISREAENFKRLATLYGLKPEYLGQTITIRGERFEIVGLNPKCRKYPILGKRADNGKVYKLPEDTVKLAFDLLAAAPLVARTPSKVTP